MVERVGPGIAWLLVEWLWAFVAGVVIAAVTTPVGVSGAVFLLPVQLSVLGVPSPAVTPTNLLYNVISVPGGLLRYARNGSLRSPLTTWILAGTLPGVVVGALIRVLVLPDGALFRLLVAAVLLPLGAWLLLRRNADVVERIVDRRVVAGLGMVAGVVGGIYGIGGGALLAPLLVGLGCSPRRVAPATLVATLLTSLTGVGVYLLLAALGYPQAAPVWSLAIASGVGGLVGGYLGAAMQPRLPIGVLSRALGVVSVALAVVYVVTFVQ